MAKRRKAAKVEVEARRRKAKGADRIKATK
jgi:hypothetical protein